MEFRLALYGSVLDKLPLWNPGGILRGTWRAEKENAEKEN